MEEETQGDVGEGMEGQHEVVLAGVIVQSVLAAEQALDRAL